MAEEKKGKRSDSKTVTHRSNEFSYELIIILLLLFFFLNFVIGFFNSLPLKNFLSIFNPNSSVSNVMSPVGQAVRLGKSVSLSDAPCGQTTGYKGQGTSGTVAEGPVFCNGERYWRVVFGDGTSGWVPESALLNNNGSQFNPGDTPIGSAVVADPASKGTEIYDKPGGSVISTEPAGVKGLILSGPEYANGEKYWQVQFDDGKTGWVPESELNNSSGSSLSSSGSPVGSGVSTNQGTDVYDTPGGKAVAAEPSGTTGTVVGGPMVSGGERYWQVVFSDGTKGWVKEGALAGANGGKFNAGDTPVGSTISSSAGTQVLDKPGGKVVKTEQAGAKGTVINGPALSNGVRYWQVAFSDGTVGWVSEKSLRNANGGAFNPGSTLVGSSVGSAGGVLKLYDQPGGKVVGSEQAGAKGTVVKGPILWNGERYWYVQFADGKTGWVSESGLKNSAGGAFNPGSTAVGSLISTSRDTNVFDMPGGTRIGSQPAGAHGVITQGPIFYNGHRYWYVKFDSGTSGWVNEDDIVFVGKETLVSKIIGWISDSFKFISTLVSLIFMSGLIYSLIRISQINSERRKKEKAKESPENLEASQKEFTNRRWERVLIHIQSDNPADWRLAVLECDIMLAELLDKMGYIGENVGEKLKTIEKSDFNSIDDAWEAHKVRNVIAHQGSDFILSKREAQRVVSLYANVFREFRYIGAGEMPPAQ